MKVLIAHHVESMWEQALLKLHGVSSEELIQSIGEFCEANSIDKIILTRFEDWEQEDLHRYFWGNFNVTVHPYAYGWCQEVMEDLDYEELDDYIEGGDHSEYVLIENWMHELKKEEVFLAGCFDGECIEDMEIALTHCEVPFKRVESCIY